MLPVRKILCPMDFGRAAQRALRVAAELASAWSSELVLVHIVEPLRLVAATVEGTGVAALALDSVRRGVVSSAGERLHWLVTAEVPPGLRVRERILFGSVLEKILDVTRAEKADLIVMGTRGRTGLTRLLLGSLAEVVARLSPCPVLVVREIRS